MWYPDVSYDHPIPNHAELVQKMGDVDLADGTEKSLGQVLSEDRYNILVSELKDEQDAANGYFILIILSVGLMVLSQFISMKSSKESNKYQTVDGRGALGEDG